MLLDGINISEFMLSLGSFAFKGYVIFNFTIQSCWWEI